MADPISFLSTFVSGEILHAVRLLPLHDVDEGGAQAARDEEDSGLTLWPSFSQTERLLGYILLTHCVDFGRIFGAAKIRLSRH